MTYDRDLAHKIFGYRLKFILGEMRSFCGVGKPTSVYEHYNEQDESQPEKIKTQNDQV